MNTIAIVSNSERQPICLPCIWICEFLIQPRIWMSTVGGRE